MNEAKTEYLLLFRNNAWYQQLSPEEIQRVMTDWMSWFDGLVAEGRCRGGQSLEHEGHVVRGPDRNVTDGPYAEAKESVAGYFILTVDSEAEALEIGDRTDCLGSAVAWCSFLTHLLRISLSFYAVSLAPCSPL